MQTLYFCPVISLWPPYGIGQTIIFILWFLSSSFFLTWSQQPHIGCLPYFDTWCGPSANLECRSATCCARLAENAGPKKNAKNWPSGRHRTTLSGYSFATKARIDNRKKNLLSSNISSTCPHNMVNFGLVVWGTPANFDGFRVLAALLHGTLVVGVSQTLRRWTESATYIRQGGHHIGHCPTFLVLAVFELSVTDFNSLLWMSLYSVSVIELIYYRAT